jgi:hypothetical protein
MPVAGALAAFTAATTAAPTAASAALPAITACALAALDSCLALCAHRLAVAGRRLGAGRLIIAGTVVAPQPVGTGCLGTGGLVRTRALAAPRPGLGGGPRPAVASRVAAALAAHIPVSIPIPVMAAIPIAASVALTTAKAARLAVRGRGSIPVDMRSRRFGAGSARPARAE